jgi:HTH-type transcriptional regulator / antitoxin HigA
MKTKTRGRTAPASYLDLVRAFPLKSVRDDVEHAAAQAVLDELLRRELDAGEQDYLDALSDLIERYEREAHPMPDAEEGAVLEVLMEGRKLSQSQLAREAGIPQSTISAVLAGTRTLTRDNILKLARYFGVNPGVFLPAGRARQT